MCSTLQEQLTISTELEGNFFNIGDGSSGNIVLVSNSSSTQVSEHCYWCVLSLFHADSQPHRSLVAHLSGSVALIASRVVT